MSHNHNNFNQKEIKQNQSMRDRVKDRLGHIRRNMTSGAANIFRSLRNHGSWVHKQLWGNHKKEGGHK